jgi:ABC-type amino acid transport substrate-binding protein
LPYPRTDSTSAQYLTGARLEFRAEADLHQALVTLARGDVDAVVYDAPILRYQVWQGFRDRLKVLPVTFERRDYGIALPTGSPLREPVNGALLQALNQPAWEESLFRYLGRRE